MQDLDTQLPIEAVLADGLIRSVFQPVVDLSTFDVVAYEALARGPEGTALESPGALFAAADRAGLRVELDWACRAAAVRGALAAGMGRETCLFINLEASSFGRTAPTELVTEIEAAATMLNVVAEITERDLSDDPASLIHQVSRLRDTGFGIAIDDLGAHPDSLALLPFLEPDVIKLDMSLIQHATSAEVAATVAAVRSDAERRGSVIVAEGIETEEHHRRALVLGASHGQGWLFARPGPLPLVEPCESSEPSAFWQRLNRELRDIPSTPWELVRHSDRVQIATKDLLLPMSLAIEQQPIPAHERPVLLSAFQHARTFTPKTAERYARMAGEASFVGVLGEGLSSEPMPGVRGGTIDRHHPLAGEWTVASVGPHRAAALIALDLGDTGPDRDRCFEYVITHDRDTVIAAATSLLRMIEPPSTHQRRATDHPIGGDRGSRPQANATTRT